MNPSLEISHCACWSLITIGWFTSTSSKFSARARDPRPRYHAQIEVGGRDLGELLVTHGWARAKGTVAILPDGKSAKEHTAKLQQLEAEARARRRGVWEKSTK